jgi:hypothetical protein
MHDYDALVRACGYYTHRTAATVSTSNEYWLAAKPASG